MKKEETYYELLKVRSDATISEIASAYHTARNAYSKDSLAAYSLFTAEEAEGILKRLEEAYATLSNLDRKRDYDRKISAPSSVTRSPLQPVTAVADRAPSAPVSLQVPSASTPAPASVALPDTIDGNWLRAAREQTGMSAEDVSRVTKIPLSALIAIESDNLKKLPARVYLLGFVTNLLKTYRVDTKAVKPYLENIDRLLKPPPTQG